MTTPFYPQIQIEKSQIEILKNQINKQTNNFYQEAYIKLIHTLKLILCTQTRLIQQPTILTKLKNY